METLLPKRPSSYHQIMRYSFRLYRATMTRVSLLSLLLAITVFLPQWIFLITGVDFFANLAPYDPRRLWVLALNLLSLMFFISMIWRMHCTIIRKKEPLREDILIGVRKILFVFIAAVLQNFIIVMVFFFFLMFQLLLNKHNLLFSNHAVGITFTIIVFLLQLAFVLYFSVLFIFMLPLIAIENNGVFNALGKSLMLVWNHWWRVFSVQITPWLLYMFLLSLLQTYLKIDFQIYFFEPVPNSLLGTFIHMSVFFFLMPWVATLLLVQLNDLEIRNHLLPKSR